MRNVNAIQQRVHVSYFTAGHTFQRFILFLTVSITGTRTEYRIRLYLRTGIVFRTFNICRLP